MQSCFVVLDVRYLRVFKGIACTGFCRNWPYFGKSSVCALPISEYWSINCFCPTLHLTAVCCSAAEGISALVAAKVVQPRTGRFRPDGTVNRLPQQSPALQTLGALILWVGWYGFNGGSVGSVSNGRSALVAAAVVNTTISAAASVLCIGLWVKMIYKKFDSGHLNNGILAGLVAISASGPLVRPEGAFIIGVVASACYLLGVEGLKWFRIDDVVQASAVHFMCGVWGLISVALLSTQSRYQDVYSYGIFSDPERDEECCGREYF